MKPRISIIVAMAKNRVIGRDGKIPWHLPEDLRRFKSLTMGHHIIMGRKTFESIGRLLPGRTSVVITRNAGYRTAGALVAESIADALLKSAGDSEIFVIGGEQIYREALPVTDRIYLTEIGSDFDGDCFFPVIESAAWQIVSREAREDAASGISFSFAVYDRIAPR